MQAGKKGLSKQRRVIASRCTTKPQHGASHALLLNSKYVSQPNENVYLNQDVLDVNPLVLAHGNAVAQTYEDGATDEPSYDEPMQQQDAGTSGPRDHVARSQSVGTSKSHARLAKRMRPESAIP